MVSVLSSLSPSTIEQALQRLKFDGVLRSKFEVVLDFLDYSPGLMPTVGRGAMAPKPGSVGYVVNLGNKFRAGRAVLAPAQPGTAEDPLMDDILETFYGFAPTELRRAVESHRLAMVAENLSGELLERYIAQELEPLGWVWCSGSSVRAVDFIKHTPDGRAEWHALQVKSRNNTENSSSSAIRKGTDISKWWRFHAKNGSTNWASFPIEAAGTLSEEGFRAYVRAAGEEFASKSRSDVSL
ncbi:SinI family restriction endonuclease [Agrococcus lahaulensis]|uniref:SinI family restriction endonuclease n=1 Tax=Agrococcus lahaulensis TaxID=341722 RepID=UPI0006860018|nr:SinI family restriction endonuclease [Agrococcus lahaulensis]